MRQPKPQPGTAESLRGALPLGLALLLIALATLVPLGRSSPRLLLRIELPDVLVNLALYFPLGLLLARRGWSVARAAVFGAIISGAIELLQGTVIMGRRGSPIDVVANVAGVALGAALLSLANHVAATRRPAARALLLILLCLPVLVWLGSGWLLAPAPPATPRWYSLWAHQFLDTEPFRGKLLAVRLQGQDVPDGVLEGVDALRADARAEGLRLDVTLSSDGPTAGPTQLASIGDLQDGTVIGMEQLGSDLMLYWMSRGSAVGLRPPRVTFANAVEAARGERLTIQASVTHSQVRITVSGPSGARSDARSLTPLTGWRNLIPSRELSARAQRSFDLVWTLVLVGYLLGVVRLLRGARLSY